MKKTTLAALGVFLVLLVAVFATREENVNVGVPKLQWQKLDPAKVTSVKVTGAHRALLERSGAEWTVADPDSPSTKHPADPGQVGIALQALAAPPSADFVSDKPSRHGEFEVAGDKALSVEVTAEGAAPLKLLLGKSSGAGVYLREAGEDAVFSARSGLGWQVRKDVNGWRKRAFVEASAADFETLTVTHADGAGFSAERKDGTWTLAPNVAVPVGFRFDPQAVERVVQTLATLSAQDFAKPGDDDAKLGLDKPQATVEAKTKDGKVVSVRLGKPTDAAVPAKREGDATAYLVASWAADALKKRVEDLRDLSLFTFDETKVTRLSVGAGATRVVLAKDGAGWKVTEPKKLPDGYELEPRRVQETLTFLRQLKGARLVADGAPGKTTALAEVVLDDGRTEKLLVGAEVAGPNGAKEHLARGAADGATYALSFHVKGRLEAGLDAFKKLPPPPDLRAMGGLEGLPPEVRKQLEQQLRGRP